MREEPDHNEGQPDASSIRLSVTRILSSARFKDSPQLQALLKYIVEEGLQGHDDALKERIIGIEIFGRKPDYDTADDPIVRSRVGQLRKRLAQFYDSEESRGTSFQVVIPSGSYRPMFVFHPEAVGSDQATGTEPQLGVERPKSPDLTVEAKAEEPPKPAFKKTKWPFVAIATSAACVVLAVAWLSIAHRNRTEFDLFWKPIFDSNKPVILYTGTIPAYLPSTSLTSKFVSQDAGSQDQPGAMFVLPALTEGQTLTSKDVVAYRNGLASTRDIAANVAVVSLLSGYRRSVEFRAGPDLSFIDLHGTPTVLIGALSNSLTLYMTRDLPFYFDHDWRIRERDGQRRVWSTAGFTTDPEKPVADTWIAQDRNPLSAHEELKKTKEGGADVLGANGVALEDYVIVARLLDSKTGGPVVIIAGLQSCGNQAAAELLTDKIQMKKLRGIPRDVLESKNLELVLHTNLVNGNPASIEVVAERHW